MRQCVDITKDTVAEFAGFLGADVAENIGREYYSGIAVTDDDRKPSAAMVWNIRNADDPGKAESEIVYFSSGDPDAGKDLLDAYGSGISGAHVTRSCFAFEEITDADRAVLKGSGFRMRQEEGSDIAASLGEILEQGFASDKRIPSHVIPLNGLRLLPFRQGIVNCLFNGISGLNDDLAMLPMEWYEKDISCCTMADGRVGGIFLVHRRPSGILMPVLLYAAGADARKEILNMLRFSANAAADKYPHDTEVLICRHDDKTRGLTSYLIPGKSGKDVIKGVRKESRR